MSVAIENPTHNLQSSHIDSDYMGPSSSAKSLVEQNSLPTPKKSPKSKQPKQRRPSKAPYQENIPAKDATTPPRASVSESNVNGLKGRGSVPDNNAKNKRKTSNTPKNTNIATSTPGSKPHHSSRPEVRSGVISRATSGTPSQAYAGPTFHASPAASSLPIPKFFAKKIQAEEAATSSSDASRLESTSEDSSEKSDDSPTMRLSHQVGGDAARDPSPLDVFFKADRRDKEARRGSCTPLLGRPEQFRAESQPSLVQTQTSTRPFSQGSPHHARHFSDNPMNHTIAHTMGETHRTVPAASVDIFDSLSSNRSITSPSVLASDPNSEEELKRKSLSLKQLLMLPSTNTPLSASRSASASPFQGSQTPTPQQRPQPPIRSASGSTTPSLFSFDGTNTPPPTLHNSRRPSYQQGRSSNSRLRREVAHNTASDGDMMPPSPTPFRSGYHPTILKNPRHNRTNPNFIPLSPASPGFPQPGATNCGPSTPKYNNESMEDTLRKVLKLDAMGSDGAHGVSI